MAGAIVRPVFLLALVAIAFALPSNYEQLDALFKEVSQGALDHVIEEPNSEEHGTPSVGAAFKTQHVAAAKPEFKDDPLATMVEDGQAENFMTVFSQNLNKLERVSSAEDMVMPPAIELDETPASGAALPNLDFKKPSQPISQGFEKLETSTASEVAKEDHVPPEGATQAAAKKAGQKEAAKVAATDKSNNKAAKKTAAKTANLSTQKKSGAVAVSKTGKLKSAKQSKTVKKAKKSGASSLRGATYFTVGLTAITALVVGSAF